MDESVFIQVINSYNMYLNEKEGKIGNLFDEPRLKSFAIDIGEYARGDAAVPLELSTGSERFVAVPTGEGGSYAGGGALSVISAMVKMGCLSFTVVELDEGDAREKDT